MKRHFTRRHIAAGISSLAALGLVGALAIAPAIANAVEATPTPPTPVATATPAVTPIITTVTLPLFGAPLVLDITSGPGGALTDVSIVPADPTWSPTVVRPTKVAFVNDAGTGTIVVKAKAGTQRVEAKAGSLNDFIGKPGGWSGDVFGNGTATTVSFAVANLAGAPDIAGVTAAGETNVISPTEHFTGNDDDESIKVAKSVIKFTNGIQTRSLTITVSVKTDEDGATHANLRIALGRISGVELAPEAAAGPHTWSAQLCDNSVATITYKVAVDGTISDVVADPATAVVKLDGTNAKITFTTGERVKISVRVKTDGGVTTLKISADAKIRCDAKAPTINGTVVPDPSAEQEHSDKEHDKKVKAKGKNKGGGDHGNNGHGNGSND